VIQVKKADLITIIRDSKPGMNTFLRYDELRALNLNVVTYRSESDEPDDSSISFDNADFVVVKPNDLEHALTELPHEKIIIKQEVDRESGELQIVVNQDDQAHNFPRLFSIPNSRFVSFAFSPSSFSNNTNHPFIDDSFFNNRVDHKTRNILFHPTARGDMSWLISSLENFLDHQQFDHSFYNELEYGHSRRSIINPVERSTIQVPAAQQPSNYIWGLSKEPHNAVGTIDGKLMVRIPTNFYGMGARRHNYKLSCNNLLEDLRKYKKARVLRAYESLLATPLGSIAEIKDRQQLYKEMVENRDHLSAVDELARSLNHFIEPYLHISNMSKLVSTHLLKSRWGGHIHKQEFYDDFMGLAEQITGLYETITESLESLTSESREMNALLLPLKQIFCVDDSLDTKLTEETSTGETATSGTSLEGKSTEETSIEGKPTGRKILDEKTDDLAGPFDLAYTHAFLKHVISSKPKDFFELRRLFETELKKSGAKKLKELEEYNPINDGFLTASDDDEEECYFSSISLGSKSPRLNKTGSMRGHKTDYLESLLNRFYMQNPVSGSEDFLAFVDNAGTKLLAFFINAYETVKDMSLSSGKKKWCLPNMLPAEDGVVDIKQGHYPLTRLRRIMTDHVVPNDTYLNAENRVEVLEGVNAAGKSIDLIKTLYIVAKTLTGSYVPALDANISYFDFIRARKKSQGQRSSGALVDEFSMVNEISKEILSDGAEDQRNLRLVDLTKLNNRTYLIGFDEIPGTSTNEFEGEALTYALVKWLSKQSGVRAITTEHFPSLREILNDTTVSGVNFSHFVFDTVTREGDLFFPYIKENGVYRGVDYAIAIAEHENIHPSVIAYAKAYIGFEELALTESISLDYNLSSEQTSTEIDLEEDNSVVDSDTADKIFHQVNQFRNLGTTNRTAVLKMAETPLTDLDEINKRLDGIEEIVNDERLRISLDEISDNINNGGNERIIQDILDFIKYDPSEYKPHLEKDIEKARKQEHKQKLEKSGLDFLDGALSALGMLMGIPDSIIEPSPMVNVKFNEETVDNDSDEEKEKKGMLSLPDKDADKNSPQEVTNKIVHNIYYEASQAETLFRLYNKGNFGKGGHQEKVDGLEKWVYGEEKLTSKITRRFSQRIRHILPYLQPFIDMNNIIVEKRRELKAAEDGITIDEYLVREEIDVNDKLIGFTHKEDDNLPVLDYQQVYDLIMPSFEALPKSKTLKERMESVSEELGCYVFFAKEAIQNKYVKPEVVPREENCLEIKNGRWGAVKGKAKKDQKGTVNGTIGNDVILIDGKRVEVIEGPNDAGKTFSGIMMPVYIAARAQAGMFVPAEYVRTSIRDKIILREKGTGGELSAFQEDSKNVRESTFDDNLYVLRGLDETFTSTERTGGRALVYGLVKHSIEQERTLTILSSHYLGLNEDLEDCPEVMFSHFPFEREINKMTGIPRADTPHNRIIISFPYKKVTNQPLPKEEWMYALLLAEKHGVNSDMIQYAAQRLESITARLNS
jgi:DNA mismatch repair ATPase MutS